MLVAVRFCVEERRGQKSKNKNAERSRPRKKPFVIASGFLIERTIISECDSEEFFILKEVRNRLTQLLNAHAQKP